MFEFVLLDEADTLKSESEVAPTQVGFVNCSDRYLTCVQHALQKVTLLSLFPIVSA